MANDANRYYEKGCQLQQAGKLNEAVATLSKAIECDTLNGRAYFTRGACHYKLGHYQLAINDIDAAVLLGCEEAQLWSKFDALSYKKPAEES